MSGNLTITEKIFSRTAGKPCLAGDFVLADIDRAMTHDITGPLAVEGFYEIMKDKKDKKVWDPEKIVILFDHQVPADSLNAAQNHIMLRKFAKEQGIKNFYDIYQGVCHQVMPEMGHVTPGMLIIGSDSHTCAYGALGAFATGTGSTDMAAALALGKLWFKVPETLRFEVNGKLGDRVYSKDVILKLIGDVGADGARYQACEYAGKVVRDLDVSQRMTISNMAIEMGGKAGIIEPDKKTEAYVKERVPGYKLDKNPEERRGSGILGGQRVRPVRNAAAGGLSPQCGQCSRCCRGRGQEDRPGLPRELHQREVRGPEDRRGHHGQEARRKGRAHDSDPGIADRIYESAQGRPGRAVHERRGHGRGAVLRALHGRVLRAAGAGRGRTGDVEPELPRPAGQRGGVCLPQLAGDGGGFGDQR